MSDKYDSYSVLTIPVGKTLYPAATIDQIESSLTTAVEAAQTAVETVQTTVQAIQSSVDNLSGSVHSHDNKEVLDTITSEKVGAWDAAEQNAKDYADTVAGQSLSDAKDYADTVAGQALADAKEYTDTKVQTEVAKVVGDAPEVLDTLKEVADWIGETENGPLATLSALEDAKHVHANKDELDSIETGDKAKWDLGVTNFDTVKNELLKVEELDPSDENLKIYDIVLKVNEMLSALTPGVKRVRASTLADVQAALDSIRDPGVVGNSEIVINITDSFVVEGQKALIIEDGKTVTLNIPEGVEITGGTITDNATKDCVFAVRNGGTLIINGKGKITGGNSQYCAIKMTITGDTGNVAAKLVVNGCTLTGKYYAICGNGNRRNGVIIVNGGTIQGTELNDSCGIFNPLGASQVTVNAGTIKGAMCVVLKSGNLTVNGGNFVAEGTDGTYTYSGNGFNSTGDCIFIESCNYPGGNPTATVKGGSFTSAANHAFGSYAGGANPPERLTGFVKTGTVAVDAGDTSAADVYA